MRRFALAVFMLTAATAAHARSPIAGRVLTVAGDPVGGASVSCGISGTVSDATGAFAFDGGEECMLSVRKRGFAHARLTVVNGGTHLMVRLTPSDDLWVVPRCGAADATRWGFDLRLAAPSGGKVQRGKDLGYAVQSWTTRKGGAAIGALRGPLVSAGLPEELRHDEDARLVQRERLWQTADAADSEWPGLDVAGRDSRGLYWRYVGRFVGEVIAYRDAVPADAATFDQMIDGMCDARADAPAQR